MIQNLGLKQDLAHKKVFTKVIYLKQARALLLMFRADLAKLVTTVIKVTPELKVDFSFADKLLTNLAGLSSREKSRLVLGKVQKDDL